MYLESIELYGFKTFVNNTKILFSPSITCIVGPNGAGKSNIVDAVRWMLGEQRLTLLRASDSTDLIFSGSSAKKQLSVASAKMIFNNESHSFAIKTPRLIIEKRIYRNKEIHYYVNGEESTFHRINSLFHSANIFGHMYAIVGQGRVDEILLARPEEKKSIIDKVAGIDVYKHKKDEAIKKLKEVEENLIRVSDRLGELKQHANHVLTEAKKAHMYYVLNDRFKEEETILLNFEIKKLKENVDIVNSGLEELEGERTDILDTIMQKKKKYDDIEEEINHLSGQKEKILQDKSQLAVERTKLLSDENRLNEKIEEFENKISENGMRIEKLQRSHEFISRDVETLSAKKSSIEKGLAKSNSELEVVKANIETLNNLLAPLYVGEKERNDKIKIIEEERMKSEKLMSALETEDKFLETKKAELEKFIADFGSEEFSNENIIKEKLESLAEKKKELASVLDEVGEKLALLKYQSNSLNEFISSHSGANLKFPAGSLGALLKLGRNFPGIEEEFNSFILNSWDDLKNYKEGTFLLDYDDIEFDVVQDNKVFLVERVLGIHSKLLSGIYYALDLKTGLDFFKENSRKVFIKKIITADGFIIISDFEVKINLDITIPGKSEELKSITKNLNETLDTKNQLNREILEKENMIKNLETELRKVIEHKERVLEFETKQKELGALTSRIQAIENDKGLLKQKVIELLQEIGDLKTDVNLKEKREELDRLKNEFSIRTSQIREIEFDIERVTGEIEEKKRRIDSIKNELEILRSESVSQSEMLERFKTNLNETAKGYQKIEIDINSVSNEEKNLKGKLKKTIEDEKTLEVDIARTEEINQEILRKMEKQRIIIAQQETEINGIKNSLREKGLPDRDIPYKVNTETLKNEIAEIKKEIDQLGPIDFTSLSEEEQIKKELEEKETVYNDVKSSKKELEKFIEEMEKRIKLEFDTTLNNIEDNFKKFFVKMFRGGESYFEKIYDDFGEIRGIEINLRLPGKKNQTLHLLSGGEKTLAAIALLFAIFKVKPSPFYILDEVDAALDEENVVRFCELLLEESDNSQFIIITHNKETMQRTEVLYGITMEEDGISKVVSLKLV